MPLTPFQIITPPRKFPKYGPFRRFLAIFSIALAISLIALFIVLILPLIRGPVHPTDPAAPLPIAEPPFYPDPDPNTQLGQEPAPIAFLTINLDPGAVVLNINVSDEVARTTARQTFTLTHPETQEE